MLQITMGSNGFQWIPMGSNGLQWVTMGYNGLQWVTMGSNVFQKIPIDSNTYFAFLPNFCHNFMESKYHLGFLYLLGFFSRFQ